MKHLTLSIIILFLALSNSTAQYQKAYNEAKRYEKKGEYYRAILFYNAAGISRDKPATSNIDKRIDFCANQLNELKLKAERMQKSVETLLRFTLKESNITNKPETKLYELFKNKGINDFNKSNYFDAIQYFKMSKLCPDYSHDDTIGNYISQSIDSLNKIKKIALVVGNGKYKNAPLNNPTKDAHDIAEALKSINFEVTLALNLNKEQFEQKLKDFYKSSQAYQIALFYFAGHNIKSDYIVPVENAIQKDEDIENECISSNNVMANLANNKLSKRIIIIDACRNNPFSRDGSRQVNSVNVSDNTIVCFSTSPGMVAIDAENNGLFTGELIKNISHINTPFQEIFRITRENVINSSNNKQTPTIYDNIQHNMYLNWKIDENYK